MGRNQGGRGVGGTDLCCGLACFEDNPRHRRSPLLRLTPSGTGALAAITEEAERSYHALAPKLEGIDGVEVRAALQHLTAVVRSE